MKIEIKRNEQDAGCKVIIDGHPVSFTDMHHAQAYVDQLQARLQAAPDAFATPSAEPACPPPVLRGSQSASSTLPSQIDYDPDLNVSACFNRDTDVSPGNTPSPH
ncbi:hypothetical protein [Pseudomonas putida]|uniref:hypothetical protein n=1 Tax=Pseudomonas putida TaxID=303 RepID=UPI00274C22C8|nr:hypothetical protein [Pseudomonas putida]EKT4485467.1 hypothetical protein [Pseudomonas putida]MDP9524556.1 hypothetical protein [Pseudomonas putida]